MTSSPFLWTIANKKTNQAPANWLFVKALEQAQKAMGLSHPNPCVGAVISREERIISVGHTEKAGGMHAEKMAIKNAQESLIGATLWVTLEPCCHFGRTPPCTDAIIDAGIKKVVFGAYDPNPKVNKKGIEKLKNAGIDVQQIKSKNLVFYSENLIKAFTKHVLKKKPYVFAKVAVSSNFALGLKGQKVKITGREADKIVHQLRRASDAIMVGGNTFKVDKPLLTARLGEPMHGEQPWLLLCSHDKNFDFSNQLTERQKMVLSVNEDSKTSKEIINGVTYFNLQSWTDLFSELASLGLSSVMIEPGQKLLQILLKEKLLDELWCFKSHKFLDGDILDIAPELKSIDDYKKDFGFIGQDSLEIFDFT